MDREQRDHHAIRAALLCDNVVNVSMPILASNDMFRADVGSLYAGTCADQTGLNGNISADPLFVDAANGDYRVRMTSPVIDAGNDAVPQIPPVDLAGGSRIVDGNGDGVEHVDMGALEYPTTHRSPTPATIRWSSRDRIALPPSH